MKAFRPIRGLFLVASIYDGILGLLFLFSPFWLFEMFQVTPPNHAGYVQFPAALLVTFGILFLQVARDPVRNRNLIPYGMLLKVSFCGVAFYHWLYSGIPDMWKPFAVADFIFLALFLWAHNTLRGSARSEST